VALGGAYDSKTIFTHKKNQLSKVMVVSKDTVLFETGDAGESRIRSYNVITGELQSLDRLSGVCRLDQAVWIDDLEQLACKEQSDQSKLGRYVLVNLAGDVSGELALPEGKRFAALTYITGQKALILKEVWNSVFGGQERSAIWVYNIQSRESLRLSDNQNLGSSSVYTDF
jgi:hypothetical protein